MAVSTATLTFFPTGDRRQTILEVTGTITLAGTTNQPRVVTIPRGFTHGSFSAATTATAAAQTVTFRIDDDSQSQVELGDIDASVAIRVIASGVEAGAMSVPSASDTLTGSLYLFGTSLTIVGYSGGANTDVWTYVLRLIGFPSPQEAAATSLSQT